MNSKNSNSAPDFKIRSDLGRRNFLRYSLGSFVMGYSGTMVLGCGGSDDSTDKEPPPVLVSTGVSPTVAKEPLILVHITDSHFDTKTTNPDNSAVTASGVDQEKTDPDLMQNLLKNFVPFIKPNAVVHTGDMTEKGYIDPSWVRYKNILESIEIPSKTKYVDIIGNHDLKVSPTIENADLSYDGGFKNFEKYSASKTRYGYTTLSGSAGTVRLIRTNTAASTLEDYKKRNMENIYGYFPSSQQQNLYSLPNRQDAVALNVVLGHNPVTENYKAPPDGYTRGADLFLPGKEAIDPAYAAQITDGNDRMKDLLVEFNAPLYLCGHTHIANLSWVGKNNTLVVTAGTFGHWGNTASFYLVSYDFDANTPSAKLVEIDAHTLPKWPIVMITAPANQALGNTKTDTSGNPRAVAFTAADTPNLRVMVFSDSQVSHVKYLLNERWTELTQKTERLWQVAMNLQGLRAGTYNVKVLASLPDGSSGEDTIAIKVV